MFHKIHYSVVDIVYLASPGKRFIISNETFKQIIENIIAQPDANMGEGWGSYANLRQDVVECLHNH